MPKQRPFIVSIAGHRIKVEWADIPDYGMYMHDDKKIVLRQDLIDDSTAFVETLRHEMLHAALALSGLSFGMDDTREESLVRCIDSIFFPAWEKVLQKAAKYMK